MYHSLTHAFHGSNIPILGFWAVFSIAKFHSEFLVTIVIVPFWVSGQCFRPVNSHAFCVSLTLSALFSHSSAKRLVSHAFRKRA